MMSNNYDTASVIAFMELVDICIDVAASFSDETDKKFDTELARDQAEAGEGDGAIMDIIAYAQKHPQLYDLLPAALYEEVRKNDYLKDRLHVFGDYLFEHELKR